MSRSLGSLTVHATCSRCETEVTFRYWWDRSVGSAGVEDTGHKATTCKHCRRPLTNEPAPDGTPCWTDDTGGDVCGWDGGNESHEPITTDCDLSETDIDNAIEGLTPDYDERDDS